MKKREKWENYKNRKKGIKAKGKEGGENEQQKR